VRGSVCNVIRRHPFSSTKYQESPCSLSLCAASWMWGRHRSVVIVPPEGGLEFWWDSEMYWCFIHVTIKLVSGTTQRSAIESCITHSSSSPRETVVREICFLVDLDRRKKMRRVCLLDSRCVVLSFACFSSIVLSRCLPLLAFS